DAAAIGASFGYDEINLNVGCPSDRVQSGRFGACLMAEPRLVAQCVRAMAEAVPASVPVTVKCRIGIDDQDSEADLNRFIDTVADAGVARFTVHARKAWLQGLSPKQNREVPPLDYARVYRLKERRPDLAICINGGIADAAAAAEHLAFVDGVMLGRAAYQTPWVLNDVDTRFFGAPHNPARARSDVLLKLRDYIADHLARDGRLHSVLRHVLGLYQGQPGARAFRRFISEHATGDAPDIATFDRLIELIGTDADQAARAA
ncbi:MAG: tRNA dihydrouridine(20/20a) synthase DusA, partial [Pseudomonadota bacterium]